MAGPSISNIAVNVGMNAAGLQKGAQQAANAVKSFTAQAKGGIGNVSTIAQQATFAVDDFFAAFSTGGVAGGIRGATNNLTMIASSLGGIKAQLAVIGALTIGQFIAKQFDGATKSANDASGAIDKATESYKRFIETRIKDIELESQTALSIADVAGMQGFADTVAQGEAGTNRAKALQAELDANLQSLAAIKQEIEANAALQQVFSGQGSGLYGMVFGGENDAELTKLRQQAEMLQEQLDAKIAARAETTKDLKAQEELNAAIEARTKELERQEYRRQKAIGDAAFGGFEQFISESDRAVMRNKIEEIADIDAAISEIQNKNRMGLSEAFGRFSGASMMGSVSAVSAINTAQYGPQNARDAGVTSLKSIEKDQRRVRELMERRQALEVVPL